MMIMYESLITNSQITESKDGIKLRNISYLAAKMHPLITVCGAISAETARSAYSIALLSRL